MVNKELVKNTFDQGKGILRLIPTFVPRRFGQPGHRLRLHPDDYFALGVKRGSMKERWFSSVIAAMNGEDAPPDEGMSYVLPSSGKLEEKFTLKDAIELLGADIIGNELMKKYGTWPMYSKFFDYNTPLFHHLHLSHEDAGRVGRLGKPEAYYFPAQLNNHLGQFPVTYFGLDPDITREEVRKRLKQYESGDNRITELSRAYRIVLDTGYYIPPGILHAPGSVLTYEPQWNSDVNSVYENIAAGEIYPRDFLDENCPKEKKDDLDYILDLMDWEENTDPHFKTKYFRPSIECDGSDESHTEYWITYGNEYISAKKLVVKPKQTVIIKDGAAYGCILIQGHGRFGVHDAETAMMLRFGQASGDEYFVSEKAAKEGVEVVNKSSFESLVILKHFGPNNPGVPRAP